MGSLNPSELTLDLKPTFIPKSIAQFLLQLSRIGSVSDKIFKLDDFVTRLESEMRKIDAFKRELPLCMILINDAIIALKEEAMVFKKSSSSEPVLEEFIPLKKSCDEDAKVNMIREEKGGGDNMKNWLSSTQLWNSNTDQTQNQKPDLIKKRGVEQDGLMTVGSDQSYTNPARSFIPLKGCFGFTMVGTPIEKDREELPIPGLSLITPGIGIKNSVRGNNLLAKNSPNTKLTPSFAPNDQSTAAPHGQLPHQQASRKQRRCWSTELHRRFVNALQQLGGSQAATPKQIRELMQVEGLTNDEVKSHLQKYRLHTRRLPSSKNASANQTGGVMGGGLWMPPQEQSSSPDGPFLTGTTTTTGGDSVDDGEDAKSESYCWKGV